jgi:predicted signal transduction protein with EAL and GGDEF domain
VSIGISLYPGDGEDAETLMKKADLAMYHAKETGRNGFRLFDSAMNASALKRIDLEARLRRALQREELALRYEPLRTPAGALVALEARLCWRHPVRGTLDAADFLAVAEETGMAAGLLDWALEHACLDAANWRVAGLAVPRLVLAATSRQLAQSELLGDALALLAAHDLGPGCIELCLGADASGTEWSAQQPRLEALSSQGVRLVLDGLADSPFDVAVLRRLPLDGLRVDASPTGDATRADRREALLAALMGLGRGLGLQVMCRGVHDEAMAVRLAAGGAAALQGPWAGDALDPQAVPAVLEDASRRAPG